MTYILRFASSVLAFIFAVGVSYFTQIELFKVLAIFAFLLVVDTITVRFLANLYMQAVYKELEKTQISMKDNNNDTNS